MKKTKTAEPQSLALEEAAVLPRNFRRLGIEQRRAALQRAFDFEGSENEATYGNPMLLELADVMVESAFGVVGVPLGLVKGFLIDGEEVDIPLAVEEPSVIAAANYSGQIIKAGGGFRTWSTEPVMKAQIFIENVAPEREELIRKHEAEIKAELKPILASLESRGGGYRGLSVTRLSLTQIVRVALLIDVRDAMGANILNTAAERVRTLLESVTRGSVLMSILTNQAEERRSGARFSLPVKRLAHVRTNGFSAEETARRIVMASKVAQEDSARAVTHNKGIMNGISSLALATGNDTRAIEAGAHAWAGRDGKYRGLSNYWLRGEILEGGLELPLAFASVGGAVGYHPASRASLKILGRPTAHRLGRIAAALGLAQNFAALLALVTGGIQQGHMKLHAQRVAYRAGARGKEIGRVSREMSEQRSYGLQAAQGILSRERGSTE
jgi:hydroxymethylglutaryl-CoA reductase